MRVDVPWRQVGCVFVRNLDQKIRLSNKQLTKHALREHSAAQEYYIHAVYSVEMHCGVRRILIRAQTGVARGLGGRRTRPHQRVFSRQSQAERARRTRLCARLCVPSVRRPRASPVPAILLQRFWHPAMRVGVSDRLCFRAILTKSQIILIHS